MSGEDPARPNTIVGHLWAIRQAWNGVPCPGCDGKLIMCAECHALTIAIASAERFARDSRPIAEPTDLLALRDEINALHGMIDRIVGALGMERFHTVTEIVDEARRCSLYVQRRDAFSGVAHGPGLPASTTLRLLADALDAVRDGREP